MNTKRVVHIGVTRASTEEWTAQQLREVTPFGEGPQLLIRDGDTKCTALRAPSLRSGPWLSVYFVQLAGLRTPRVGAGFDRVAEGANIEVVQIALCAPRMCRRGKIQYAGAFHEGLRFERQRGDAEGAVTSVCKRFLG